jgi:hypothetical protein
VTKNKDDPSSAPESGTARDDTSGNAPPERADEPETEQSGRRDDPSTAGEER